MTFKILTSGLLSDFTKQVGDPPEIKLNRQKKPDLPVDSSDYYKLVASVYSSKIEGEDIEFDSYFKHKFMRVPFKADYTCRTDDLYAAYAFIETNPLTLLNTKRAHVLLSAHLLSATHQEAIRTNLMVVINRDDRIEYVAVTPDRIETELDKLFHDIDILRNQPLNSFESFYYAAMIHLVFVKIHPFQDGNGRTARLIEKWFLLEKLGTQATAIHLEKNYFLQKDLYYSTIRKIGLEYDQLDYNQSLGFLLMTAKSLTTGDEDDNRNS